MTGEDGCYAIRLGSLHSERCDLFGPFADDSAAWDYVELAEPKQGDERSHWVVRRANTAAALLGFPEPAL